MSGVTSATVMAGMAVASGAAAIGGGMMGAAGASAGASGAASAATYNARVYERQAQIAERNKQIALDKAGVAATDQKYKNRAVQGQIRAAYGSSGLSVDGSPLDVLEATSIEQNLDIEKILYSGQLEAIGAQDSADSYRMQAQLAYMGSSNALIAGQYGMATSMISGLGGAAQAGSSFFGASRRATA